MKILMYSDLHISRTSSILPISGNDNRHTYRQAMIVKTGEFIANTIKEQQPDVIVNLGDTFDQHTITSYDVDTASDFFECFKDFNIPHYVLVGNHEMVNQDFNAIKLLRNIPNITVIDNPTSITATQANNENESVKLAFLPYCDYKEILKFPEGTYLFSHQDIQGSSIRGDFTLPDGIEPNELKERYKLVFNGHIHKPSIMGNIVNVGSITTHSFSDDDNSVPQCYIFDTNTMDLQIYKPNVCPLFRKVNIDTLEQLNTFLSNLDSGYKYCLHCLCPFEIKEQVKNVIDNSDLVIANRLNVKITKQKEEEEIVNINLQSNTNVYQSFKEFIDTADLKYPKDLYIDVLNNL